MSEDSGDVHTVAAVGTVLSPLLQYAQKDFCNIYVCKNSEYQHFMNNMVVWFILVQASVCVLLKIQLVFAVCCL